MNTKDTTVLSFRVPKAIVSKVDRQAKRQKQARAKFIENLFMHAFEQHVQIVTNKKEAEVN